MLYEDYFRYENPYPSNNNVLNVHFGAWTDDEDLISVLKNKSYVDSIDFWRYGNQHFDTTNKEQLNMLKLMIKTVSTIDKSQKTKN